MDILMLLEIVLFGFLILFFNLLLLVSIKWRRQWQPTPVLLPGESHGRRSLVSCGPWGHWELDTTERLHFYFSLSFIGEGNATHSSILAWRIPGTEESVGLPSMGSHRVGHGWCNLAAAAAAGTLKPGWEVGPNVVGKRHNKYLNEWKEYQFWNQTNLSSIQSSCETILG